MYVKEYWEDKHKRAIRAIEHTDEMSRDYPDFISTSVKSTKVYNDGFVPKNRDSVETNIYIVDIDSVGAIMEYSKYKTAVLNFASYKHPGGMFINGSKAQEECLCHESFLYNVLSQQEEFYEWNYQHKNRALYLNRALYSPNILFKRDDVVKEVDVITCAAPNWSTAKRYCNVNKEENSKVLKSRIKFVLDIAKNEYVQTLILGAYGCGVFGQDATEVASIFREYLTSDEYNCFNSVIFAIPKGNNNNLSKFIEVFK